MTVSTPVEIGDVVVVQVADDGPWLWATVTPADPQAAPRVATLGGLVRVELQGEATFYWVKADQISTPVALLAGAVAAEVYAQLEELSDETAGLIGALAPDDEILWNRLHAIATDFRETLQATLDVRIADWLCDNADAHVDPDWAPA